MTANTDPVRALIGEMTEYLDQQVDPELDVIAKWRDRLEAALASAPPSAPEPEVHSYDPTEHRESVTIRWPDGKCLGYVLDRTRYTDNLPPSAPVVVDDALIAGAMEAAADATRHRPGAREGGGVMDRTMQMVYETEREQYEQAMREQYEQAMREQYEQAMRIVPEAGLGGGDD